MARPFSPLSKWYRRKSKRVADVFFIQRRAGRWVRSASRRWSAAQLVRRVLSTARPLPGLAHKTVTGGIVDAARALGLADAVKTPTAVATPAAPSPLPTGFSGSNDFPEEEGRTRSSGRQNRITARPDGREGGGRPDVTVKGLPRLGKVMHAEVGGPRHGTSSEGTPEKLQASAWRRDTERIVRLPGAVKSSRPAIFRPKKAT